MAKGKGKQSTGANSVPVKGSAIKEAPKADTEADTFPQIEESAFAGLRQKIEQRLKDGANKQKSKTNKSKPAPVEDAKKPKQSPAKSDAKSKSGSDKNNQGKKRDRNGDVIARDEKKQDKSQKPANKDGDDTLRQEILALGGTEEDFEMLAGVDSEEEDADTSEKSKGNSDDASLRKELSSILAAAGQFVPDDLEDEDVEEEVDGEEDDEEVEEDEDEEKESEEAAESDEPSSESELAEEPSKKEPKQPAKKEVKQSEPEVVFPKEFSKLVSTVKLTIESDTN
jgi:ribosome biogenesis protein MAK21